MMERDGGLMPRPAPERRDKHCLMIGNGHSANTTPLVETARKRREGLGILRKQPEHKRVSC